MISDWHTFLTAWLLQMARYILAGWNIIFVEKNMIFKSVTVIHIIGVSIEIEISFLRTEEMFFLLFPCCQLGIATVYNFLV